MKRLRTLITSVLLLAATAGISKAELARGAWGAMSMDVESSVYANLLDGATGYSVLREGNYSVHNIDLGYERDFGGLKLESGLAARVTDDTLVDDDRAEVRRWHIGLGAVGMPLEYSLRLGDVYGELSDYTFSQPLFGFAGYLQFGDFMFKPIYGRQNEARENLMYQRDSYGVRAEQVFFDRVTLGLNYVDTKDDPDSVDDDSGISMLEENTVTSLDFRSMISRNFVVSGNYAQSEYEDRKATVTEQGAAYNIRTVYRTGALTGTGEYEVVGSSFNSISGYATKDRKIMSGSLRYSFFRRVDLAVSYENISNNLNGALPYRTTVLVPAVRSDIILARGLNLNLGYKMRLSNSDDSADTVDREAVTYLAGMNYRYKRTLLGVDGSMTGNTDKKDTGNDYDNLCYRISGRGDYRLVGEKVKLLPMLIYSTSLDELSEGDNTSTSITAGTGLLLGRSLELDLKNTSSIIKRKTAGSDTARNTFRASALYSFPGETRRTIGAEYSLTDYDSEGAAADYSEAVLEITAGISF